MQKLLDFLILDHNPGLFNQLIDIVFWNQRNENTVKSQPKHVHVWVFFQNYSVKADLTEAGAALCKPFITDDSGEPPNKRQK